MFGQSLLSGAFGTALVPDENFGINLYTGTGANQTIGGKIKGAASFNGSSSYIQTGFTLPADSTMSFSFWLYPVAFSGDSYIWSDLASSGSGSTRGLDFYINSSGELLIQILTTTNLTYALGASALNTWVNLVVTINGNNVILYKNGSSVASSTTGDSLGTVGPRQVTLGRAGDYSGGYFDGSMDQIRIFNTELTQSQVNSLASETASTASTLNFPSGAGCLVAYQFDSNFNTILSQADLSTVNFPSGTTGAALYQFENSANGDAGPNPTTTTNLTYVDGAFGRAIDFNGSNSVWQSTTQIIEAQQDFTISLWVRVEAFATSSYLWTSYATGDCAISMAGNAGTNKFSFHKYNNTQSPVFIELSGSDVVTLGKWYHLCGTFSTTTGMVFYIDGVSVGSDSTTWVPQDHGAYSDSIGCYGYTPSGNRANFNGQIDQFRAYQQVLTAAQVLELAKGDPKYNGGSITANLNGWTNFKPGFTWFKKRNGGTGNNLLQNSPGLKTSLSSNTANAAGYFDQYGYLSSFDTQGFTTQGGSSGSYPYDNVGESGSDYVSWNWKAGTETYSTYFNGTEGSGGSYAYGVPAAAATALRTAAAFSISIWVNPDQTAKPGTYDPEIVRFLNNIYLRLIYQDGGTVQIYVSDSSNTGRSATSSALTPGKWTHICATGSSSGLVLYIDGTQVDTDTWDGTFVTYSSPYYQNNTIGSAENTGSSPPANPHSVFKGYLSQYRLYNTQLTSTQVSTLYNETADTNATLNYPAGAGAIALYQLKGNCTETSGTYSPTSEANLAKSNPNYLGGNTDGSLPSQVNANVNAGFSIVKWASNASSSSASVGHGLGKSPELVTLNNMDTADAWYTYVAGVTGNNQYIRLNTTDSVTTAGSDSWGAGPTSTVMGLRPATFSSSGNNIVMYCWTSIPKYSKIGTYSGTGTTNNITGLGFEPAWVLIKCTDTGSTNWQIWDNKRPTGYNLFPNLAIAEVDNASTFTGFTADGFTVAGTSQSANASGSTYLYMAFAG